MTTRLLCACCGYDLRGLALTAVCPECGTPVSASVEAAQKFGVPASPKELERLRKSARLVLGVVPLSVALTVGPLIARTAGGSLCSIEFIFWAYAASPAIGAGVCAWAISRSRPPLALTIAACCLAGGFCVRAAMLIHRGPVALPMALDVGITALLVGVAAGFLEVVGGVSPGQGGRRPTWVGVAGLACAVLLVFIVASIPVTDVGLSRTGLLWLVRALVLAAGWLLLAGRYLRLRRAVPSGT